MAWRGQEKTGYNRVRHALWDQDQCHCGENEWRVNGEVKDGMRTGNTGDEVTSQPGKV